MKPDWIDSDRRAFKHTSWMWCSLFLCLFNRRVKRSDNVTGGWALAEERGFNETSGGDRTTPLTDRRAPAKSQRGQDTCHVQQVCIKGIVYTFIVLQKISVHQRILKKLSWFAQKYDLFSKCFLSSKSVYYYDFWRSCDTEDWRNYAEYSALSTGINYVLKYIQIESSYFKLC